MKRRGEKAAIHICSRGINCVRRDKESFARPLQVGLFSRPNLQKGSLHVGSVKKHRLSLIGCKNSVKNSFFNESVMLYVYTDWLIRYRNEDGSFCVRKGEMIFWIQREIGFAGGGFSQGYFFPFDIEEISGHFSKQKLRQNTLRAI